MTYNERKSQRSISLQGKMWDFLEFKARQKKMSISEFVGVVLNKTHEGEIKDFTPSNRPFIDL